MQLLMSLYEVVGTKNPETDWTTSIVLERDEDGNVVREVGVGLPLEMSAEEAQQLEESTGVVLDTVTKKDLREREQAQNQPTGADSGAQSPIVGDAPKSNDKK